MTNAAGSAAAEPTAPVEFRKSHLLDYMMPTSACQSSGFRYNLGGGNWHADL
jgi:hypothetical protein